MFLIIILGCEVSEANKIILNFSNSVFLMNKRLLKEIWISNFLMLKSQVNETSGEILSQNQNQSKQKEHGQSLLEIILNSPKIEKPKQLAITQG